MFWYLIGAAVVVIGIGIVSFLFRRSRADNDRVQAVREGDIGALVLTAFLGASFLPGAVWIGWGLVATVVLWIIGATVWWVVGDWQVSWEATRPLTAAELQIAQKTALYYQKHGRLPALPRHMRGAQVMQRITPPPPPTFGGPIATDGPMPYTGPQRPKPPPKRPKEPKND